MMEARPGQEGWRYARGAVFAIFIPSLLIGISIALNVLFVGGPIALLIIPMALFYGAIIGTPFVLIGIMIAKGIRSFTALHWWHAALTGSTLILVPLLTFAPPSIPWSNDQMMFFVGALLFGAFSGTLFWYFGRPANQANKGNVEQ